jgi:peptide/nickel transport system ATP-binding protein/oligopeptide transport system ATP-binding protein
MTALLDVSDLKVTFTTPRGLVHAVDGVSFSVARGEVLGIVGESGSGKSVTLRAIPRLLHANASVSGRALWQGTDLIGMDGDVLRRTRGGRASPPSSRSRCRRPDPVLPIGLQIDEVVSGPHADLDPAIRN